MTYNNGDAHVDGPQAIAPTDKERLAGVYSPRNLQRVLGALHQDGLVVLKNVIDKEHVDSLNAVMTAEAEERIADPEQQFNHNVKCEIPPPPLLARASWLSYHPCPPVRDWSRDNFRDNAEISPAVEPVEYPRVTRRNHNSEFPAKATGD